MAKEVIWGAKLDPAAVLSSLKAILSGLKEVQGQFAQGLTVKIDTQDLTEILNTLRRGFISLGADFSTSMANSSLAVIDHLDDIGKKIENISTNSEASLAKAIAAGARSGADQAKKALGEVEADLTRFDDRMNNVVTAMVSRASKLGQAGQDRVLSSGIDIYSADTFTSLDKSGRPYASPSKIGDSRRMLADAAAADKAVTDLHASVVAADKAGTKLSDDFSTGFERAAVAIGKAGIAAQQLAEKQEKAQLQQSFGGAMRARDRGFKSEEQAIADGTSPVALGPMTQAQSQAAGAPAAAKAAADAAAARKQALADLLGIKKGHDDIGQSMLANALHLAGIVVAYRVMRDTIREIETLISGFINAGISYQKQLEDNEASLTGILAANFSVANAQGDQLTGQAKINALQVNSRDLYSQIVQASKDTHATTKDLVEAYEALAEPAVRFKQSTQDILNLTTLTATAAKSLGVTPSAAATQVGQILSGKGAGGSFTRGIGINASDIEMLKGTPALLDLVVEHLKKFDAANTGVDNSLSGVQARFSTVVGQLSSSVEAPFFAQFKEFVRGAEDFFNSDAGKTLFATIGRSGTSISSTLKQSGHDLFGDTDGMNATVVGVTQLINGIIILGTKILETVKSVAEFTANNKLLLESIVGLYAIYSASNFFVKVGVDIVSAINGTGAFATALRELIPGLDAVAVQTAAVGTAGAVTKAEFTGLQLAMVGIVSAGTIAAFAGFFAYLMVQLANLVDHIWTAHDAMKALASGDYTSATQGTLQNIRKAPNSAVAGDESRRLSSITDDRVNELAGLTSGHSPSSYYADLTATLKAYEDQLSKVTDKESAEAKQLRIAIGATKDKQTAVTQAMAAASEAARLAQSEQSKIKKQVDADLNKGSNKSNYDPLGDPEGLGAVSQRAALSSVNADLVGNLAKGKAQLDFLREQQALIDTAGKGALSPSPSPDNIDYKKEPFKDSTDKIIAAKKSELALDEEYDKLAVAKRDMFEDEFQQRQFAREKTLSDFIVAKQQERQEKFDAYKQKNSTLPKGKQQSQDYLDGIQTNIDTDTQRGLDSAEIAGLKVQEAQAKRAQTFKDLLEKYEDTISIEEDRVVGVTADTAVARWQKVIDKIKSAVPGSEAEKSQRDADVKRAEALLPQIKADALNSATEKSDAITSKSLDDQETRLGKLFQANAVSVSDYVNELRRLKGAKVDVLNDQLSTNQYDQNKVSSARATIDPNDTEALAQNDQAMSALQEKANDLKAKLDEIYNDGAAIRDMFKSWATVLQDVSSFLAPIDAFGQTFKSIRTDISSIIGSAGQFTGIISQLRQVQALTQIGMGGLHPGDSGATQGFSFSSMLGGLGGAQSGSQATSLQTAMGALTVAGTAAGVAIGIASALFTAAVKRNEQDITESIKGINDALKAGTITTGQALAEMQAERVAAVQQYSSSKAGRKALDDLLPGLDQTIADMKAKIQSVRDSFQQFYQSVVDLAGNSVGSGPFADFYKTIFSLQQQTKAYLDTFVAGTADYVGALQTIQTLFNVTLTDAKQKLEQNMQGFESEAVASAQKVISLLDNQQNIYDQLLQAAQSQSDLMQQRTDLITQQQRASVKFEQQRADAAQGILDLEKQIADVLANQVNSALKVRQQGVLQATQTIAQSKANQISDINNTADDQVYNLTKQLQKAYIAQDDLTTQIGDSVTAYQRQNDQLDRQQAALDKQNASLMQQLHINTIQVSAAQTVADLEGQTFNLASDRYGLEEQAAGIEIAQAKTKVDQWSQTKQLIDSIVNTGNGVIFNPPPGFPQIKVTIGNIVIDNSDNSQTQVTVPVPGGGAGSPGPTGPGPSGPNGPGRGNFDGWIGQYGDTPQV